MLGLGMRGMRQGSASATLNLTLHYPNGLVKSVSSNLGLGCVYIYFPCTWGPLTLFTNRTRHSLCHPALAHPRLGSRTLVYGLSFQLGVPQAPLLSYTLRSACHSFRLGPPPFTDSTRYDSTDSNTCRLSLSAAACQILQPQHYPRSLLLFASVSLTSTCAPTSTACDSKVLSRILTRVLLLDSPLRVLPSNCILSL